MKKYLFLIATAITLGFTSCSEDSDGGNNENNSSSFYDIVGSWYEEAENEEIRYLENGRFYDKYSNVRRCGEAEGSWEYDSKNKKLTWRYSFLGQNYVADWKVENLTEIGLTISSDVVAEHKCEKIVETYRLEVGKTVNIQFPASHPTYNVLSYTSNNERLASVTDNGIIKAEGEKGTTYIKVVTDKGNVWVKVVVGDECADLWYDYVSLMGANYDIVRKTLGVPAISGEDGHSFGFTLPYNDLAKEIDVFLDSSTGLVDEMGLVLKYGVVEEQILSYMKSHYYPYSVLGSEYYTTSPELENSSAVVRYDKRNNCIRFISRFYYIWPDYTDTFGLTTDQIVSRFGDLYYGTLPYYSLINYYVGDIYFLIDKKTDKVTAFQLGIISDEISVINSFLSSKYRHYKTNETNTMFVYRDGETQETSKVMIIYNTENKTVIYYDLENYNQ